MPFRCTVADVRTSRFSREIGLCNNNLAEIIPVINECTQRLIYAAGSTGWSYGWRKVAFNVTKENPYITLPREFARIVNMDVCRHPVRIQNAFYEFLPGGIGLQSPPSNLADWCGTIAGYERDNVPTMVDMNPTNQFVRAYITDIRDVGKRMLITGLDQNGFEIFSTDGANNVKGTFLVFASPFITTTFHISQIQALQKDVTFGDVVIKGVDGTTGLETTLARLAPTETNPWYRRYYVSALPLACCKTDCVTSTIEAIVKLEYVPVTQDTDQLLIPNIPALIEEALALRYSGMDVVNAAALEDKHHRKAIKLLQNEQRHVEGDTGLAVTVSSFAGQGLCRDRIGALT